MEGGEVMGSQPLTGKTALVTGAARNIGRATALRLAGSGANIVVNALKDRDAAEAVRSEIEATGGRGPRPWRWRSWRR